MNRKETAREILEVPHVDDTCLDSTTTQEMMLLEMKQYGVSLCGRDSVQTSAMQSGVHHGIPCYHGNREEELVHLHQTTTSSNAPVYSYHGYSSNIHAKELTESVENRQQPANQITALGRPIIVDAWRPLTGKKLDVICRCIL